MDVLNWFFILSFTLFLSSCGKSDADKIDDLNARLKSYEDRLGDQDDSTVAAIESGQCQLQEVDENSAQLKCGNNSFTIQNGKDGIDGKDGVSCQVIQNSNGASISCSDGSVAIIVNGTNGTNGADGSDGSNGQDGEDGGSCAVTQTDNGATIDCADGTHALIANGENGSTCQVTDEAHGAKIECSDGTVAFISDGQDGEDGTSCSVEPVPGVGALITCGNTSALITNGRNGQDAISPVIEIITPCGEGKLDEVLLKLSDGKILGHYSDGKKLNYLTIVLPGQYQTTDGTSCNFTVTDDGNVKW